MLSLTGDGRRASFRNVELLGGGDRRWKKSRERKLCGRSAIRMLYLFHRRTCSQMWLNTVPKIPFSILSRNVDRFLQSLRECAASCYTRASIHTHIQISWIYHPMKVDLNMKLVIKNTGL